MAEIGILEMFGRAVMVAMLVVAGHLQFLLPF